MKNKRLPIILTILSLFIIIGILLIIIFQPVTDGYEISIYDAFPWYFWLLILISSMLSLLIIFFDFIKGNKINNKQCLLGILIIVFICFILLSLPYFRGYATYGREDHLSHIGIIREIIINGKIGDNNFYPNYHILISFITEITGVDIINLSTFIPRIFPFIFLIGFFVFLRVFLKKIDFRLSLIFIISLFFFSSQGNYLAPYYQSFLLIPIILFLYFKRNTFEEDLRYTILLIIILISYIMYHPLNAILLMLVFLVSIIVYLFSKKFIINHSFEKSLFNKKTIFPFILSFIIFSEWYLSFSSINNTFRNAFFSIFYGSGVSESTFSNQFSIIQNYSVFLEDLIKVGIFKYGILAIFSFLSFFSILYLLIEIRKKNGFKLPKAEILFLSLIISSLFSLTILSFMFSGLLGWGRYFIWVIFFSILILPISLEVWLNKKSERKIFLLKRFSVVLILFLILFISLFSFFGSPLVMDVNQQVTSQEILGFKFLLEKRNVNNLIDEIGISQSRYYDAFHNLNTSSTNIRRYDTNPPDHFGYNITHNLGFFYNSTTAFLIISKLGTIQYPMKYPNNKEVWIFNNKDFNLMLEDKTVNRIYTTDFEFDIFIINS